MKTKLVYVLTCAPDGFYIEEALMAIFSARHWNPDAYIVLITDDLTDKLLTGKRAEILQYITEKIVVSFEDASLSMVYRSRYIKTSVRQLITGDFLFVDSDTITQRSLADIDNFSCEVGAVWESHLKVEDFCEGLFKMQQGRTLSLGVDLLIEKEYFSSGVVFVRDTPETLRLYELWHHYWQESQAQGLAADQPSLAKANRAVGHLIQPIPDTYNSILFVQPTFTEQAHILHISSYRNPSLLFAQPTLSYVREHGTENIWLQEAILHPTCSFLPFDYEIVHSTFSKRHTWISRVSHFLAGYGQYIDTKFKDFQMASRLRSLVIACFRGRQYRLGMTIWMIWKRIHLRLKHTPVTENVCKK